MEFPPITPTHYIFLAWWWLNYSVFRCVHVCVCMCVLIMCKSARHGGTIKHTQWEKERSWLRTCSFFSSSQADRRRANWVNQLRLTFRTLLWQTEREEWDNTKKWRRQGKEEWDKQHVNKVAQTWKWETREEKRKTEGGEEVTKGQW